MVLSAYIHKDLHGTMGTLVVYIWITVSTFALHVVGANTTLPIVYPARILERDGSQTCSPDDQETVRNEIKAASLRLIQIQLGYSCGELTSWRRVAYLNMSDPSQQCPSVWQETTTPHRVCGTTSYGCAGVTYSTGSVQYDQVCGRIISYQFGSPDAFGGSGSSIDTYYVDGVSVTRGSPRQHIWTFAAGVDEQTVYRGGTCPCVTGSTNGNNIPSFVGQNYFCESGLTMWNRNHILFPEGDPLWDGQGCGPTSSCCTFNSPPWFNVQLPSPTTDDIEVRICSNIAADETPIQLVELYVNGYSCGGSTGWRRVAYLNMSDPSMQCPSVWREITTPHRVCGRRSSTGSCEGLTYSTGNEQYNQVCGRIIGYQLGNTDSFRGSSQSIDTYYVDGVSLTHGSPRQHIWTFATGVDEQTAYSHCCTCPCVAGSRGGSFIPSFVGQNYFCESGLTQWNGGSLLWPDGDPLWDGQGCGPTSSCCTFNSPPWFSATLPSSTTDDIEVRICDTNGNHEDSPIQLVELYVK